MHGEIGGAKPARAVAPSRAPRGGNHGLQHRHVAPSSGGAFGIAPAAKAVVVMMAAGSSRASAVRTNAAASGSLRLVTNSGAGASPARKRFKQRVDRRGVGGEQHRPIEDDRNNGRPAAAS